MKESTFERSSGNVFADLGLLNPEERMAKALLSRLIHEDIERRGLTQKATAQLLGCAQPDVSKIVRGNVSGFSLERLTTFLTNLGHDVEIRVSMAKRSADERGHLLVTA